MCSRENERGRFYNRRVSKKEIVSNRCRILTTCLQIICTLLMQKKQRIEEQTCFSIDPVQLSGDFQSKIPINLKIGTFCQCGRLDFLGRSNEEQTYNRVKNCAFIHLQRSCVAVFNCQSTNSKSIV